ncbi:MAG: polysaccharide deacetylase family protein [Rhodomicrobium sp.]
MSENSIYLDRQWDDLFQTEDPWDDNNVYERAKRAHTFAQIPLDFDGDAAELACGEGFFTQMLAPRVKSLLAVDLSSIALTRARQRCSYQDNIAFLQLDFFSKPLPRTFSLIVCSEALYFCGKGALRCVVKNICDHLSSEGYLISVHSNFISDVPGETAFDQKKDYSALTIKQSFLEVENMQLIRELRTPLYSVLLLKKSSSCPRATSEIKEVDDLPILPKKIAERIEWNGTKVTRRRAAAEYVSEELPVLMYHGIEDVPPDHPLPSWRLSPSAFEQQVLTLRQNGFRSIGVEDWWSAAQSNKKINGRAVIITFDDAFTNFLNEAFPILKKYDFTATVFVPTGYVGKTADWDSKYNCLDEIMTKREIRFLSEQGITFGSHTETHPHLTAISRPQLLEELKASKEKLEDIIGAAVSQIAYPHGDCDDVVVGQAMELGYEYGFVICNRRCSFGGDKMRIPRVIAPPAQDINEFYRLVGIQAT